MARGVNSKSFTKYEAARSLLSGTPTAAPAGDTCLKEAAAGKLSACLSS